MSPLSSAYSRTYEDTPEKWDDNEFLKLALERFKFCAEAENEFRKECLSDLKFYQGEGQWDLDIKNSRIADRRPCLTINRLPQFVHQVSNEVRQNKPAAKVSPVDDYGDVKTAETIQGIIRHIERQSLADTVRSYAAWYQIVCGRGYYRIIAKHADPMSFDQELYLERIKNPLTVYMDPTCQEPDYSDAKWAFIIEDLTRDAFKAMYPQAELSSAEEFRSTGDGEPDWASHDKIRVAEYFTRDLEDQQIVMLADGSVVPLEQLPPGVPVQIIAQRTTKIPRVRWHKITCYEVLRRRDWMGQWIPIIPVLGEEYSVDGKTQLLGMVRNAKDPQRMLNYWESAKTETIALAPRVPFIAAEGQLENHEKEWAQANVKNFAVLQYKVKEVGGTLVPAPQRQIYEPPIQAISMAQAGAVDNLKAATGIYDASLGNRSNETSGIAIRQRQSQGDTANYHYVDNLATSITFETRQLIDLIPKIYDRPGRVARIIGEDGHEEKVTLNAPYQDKSGETKMYDLNAGRYDVAIDIGPSYKTKRQEAVESMLGFAQVAPGLVPMYADLFAKAMDWPLAAKIAERVRPPNLPPEGEEEMPPQAMAVIQQMKQENEQLTQALNEASRMLESKQLELESKERIAGAQIQSDERIAMGKDRTTLVTKSADVGSRESISERQARTALAVKGVDTGSQERMKSAELDSREAIALLQAEVDAIKARLAATTKTNGAAE
jgi:uncharacterized small protein (DUF1192 family)